jgi:hypothetical protein
VAKSRGRGRDADAPAGGQRGPNSDYTTHEDDDDNDCNNNEASNEDMEENHEQDGTQESGQGEAKRSNVVTPGGRMVGGVAE